ncbi:MAG: hypothetical protein MJK12_07145 [Colwellia sp.]|nr:hypothetical protein [Colwellia sp.]
MTVSKILPSWFKPFAIVSLVWNLIGILAFVAQVLMTPEALAALPQGEQNLIANTPLLATIAFAFAVFGGVIGCLALLMKKTSAITWFTFSLLGIAVQMFHAFFMLNSFAVFGPGGLIMPIMVAVWAIALLTIARKAKSENWLN